MSNLERSYKVIEELFKNEKLHRKRLLDEMLKQMGILLNADYLEINIYNRLQNRLNSKYTWQNFNYKRKNTWDIRDFLKFNPILEMYKDRKYFLINSLKSISKKHKTVKKVLKLFRIKSLFVYPLKISNQIIGDFTIKNYHRNKKITPKQVEWIIYCCELLEKHIKKINNNAWLNLFKRNYTDTLDNIDYAIALLDQNNHLIYVNDQFEKIFDINRTEVYEKNFLNYISNNNRHRLIDLFDNNKKEKYHEIFKIINGKKKIIQIYSFRLVNQYLHATMLYFKDVTEKKVKETEIKKMAYFDLRTDLHNRNYFNQVCKELQKKPYSSLGVIVFDIDHLKEINKQFGYKRGDEFISLISNTLKQIFESEYLVSRIDGDEFAVFILDQKENQIVEKIKKFQSEIDASFGHNIMSIGYCFADYHDDKIEDLVHQAYMSMYKHKKSKKIQQKKKA